MTERLYGGFTAARLAEMFPGDSIYRDLLAHIAELNLALLKESRLHSATVEERDGYEERIVEIGTALGMSENELEWSSANDPGAIAVERAAKLVRERDEARGLENGIEAALATAKRRGRERDEAREQAARMRTALEQWVSVAIEEGDLRLMMSSLSGRALDKEDIDFSIRWGSALHNARTVLTETPNEALEEKKWK